MYENISFMALTFILLIEHATILGYISVLSWLSHVPVRV
jgi:hypothetical protein